MYLDLHEAEPLITAFLAGDKERAMPYAQSPMPNSQLQNFMSMGMLFHVVIFIDYSLSV
jgi:hypothetical protein